MDWTEVKITVDAADTDRASAIANMVVPYGIYIEDYSDLIQGAREIAHIDLIDEELLARDRTGRSFTSISRRRKIRRRRWPSLENGCIPRVSATKCWPARSASRTGPTIGRPTSSPFPWVAGCSSVPPGRRWRTPGGRAVLSIDPGMAFGTGGHDTTRLVLEALEDAVSPGAQLLDVGCGSGILSIAALLLGAEKAVGVDIDPLAVKTARENGELNGFTPPVLTILHGDLVDKVEGRYDVVAANIVADAIIALSPSIPRFLKPGGVYIASGIIDTREAEVLSALAACGFAVETRREHGGWLCLTLRYTG